MTCPHCGSVHDPGAQFCPATGKPITAAPVAAAAAPAGLKGVGALLEESIALYTKNFVPLVIAVGVVLLPLGLLSGGLRLAMAPSSNEVGSLHARSERMQERSREYHKRSEELQRTLRDGSDEEKAVASRRLAELGRKMANDNLEDGAALVSQAGGMLARVFGFALLALLIIPLHMLANFLAQAVVVPMVGARALGSAMDPAAAWKLTLTRLVPLATSSIIGSLAVGVGLLFCLLPGLVLAFLFSLTSPVVMLERRSGVDALKRSADLVKRHWVDVLLVLIVYVVISMVLHFVFGAIGGVFGLLLGEVARIALFPLPIIMTVLLYLDLRRVDEGIMAEDLHRSLE